jgi:hypothetical protein
VSAGAGGGRTSFLRHGLLPEAIQEHARSAVYCGLEGFPLVPPRFRRSGCLPSQYPSPTVPTASEPRQPFALPPRQAAKSEHSPASPAHSGVAAAGDAIKLAQGGLWLAAGPGLWKLRNWARILTVILSVSYVTDMGYDLLTTRLNSFDVIGVAIYACILWYMFRSRVKQAFGVT